MVDGQLVSRFRAAMLALSIELGLAAASFLNILLILERLKWELWVGDVTKLLCNHNHRLLRNQGVSAGQLVIVCSYMH